MRRALIRALAALLLLAVGAALGLGLAGRTAPRALHAAVEASLSDALGTPVSIASARLLVFPGVTVEALDVAAWPRDGVPAFSAKRFEATLDPAALLSGRIRFSGIAFDGASLRLEHGADGHWSPPVLTPGLEDPLVVLGRLFAARLPAPTIDIRDGTLSVVDHAVPPSAGGPLRFDADDLSVRLIRSGLLEPGRLRLLGTLRGTKGRLTPFELDAAGGRGDRPRAELAFTALGLESMAPYLASPGPKPDLAGRATGVISLSPTDGGATRLEVDVDARTLRIDLGPRAGALTTWEHLAVEGALHVGTDALTLATTTIVADEQSLTLAGSLGRPLDASALLRVEAHAPSFDVATLRAWGDRLSPALAQHLAPVTGIVASGAVSDLALQGEASVARWQETVGPGGAWLPPGAVVSAAVREVVLRPPGDEPLRVVGGNLRLEAPDLLVVSGLEGRLGARVLPILDLRLAGLRHVVAAETPSPVAPAPALPGRPALKAVLFGPPDDTTAPGWTSLDLEFDWLLNPVFFRPLRGVKARFTPIPGGQRLVLEEAAWGGVPIRGEGTWTATPPERVRIAIEAGEREAPRGAPASPESWAHGRFDLQRAAAPGLRIETLRGGFDLSGTRLTLFDTSARLGVPGHLAGDARLDLGREGEVPASLRLALVGARTGDLLAALADDPARGTGTVDIQARLEGSLRPEARFLTSMNGDATLTARDGELAVELPMFFAIAKASTTFNPFGSAEGIRFDRIEAVLRIEDGRISTKRTLAIESPDLRLAISGSVDIRERPFTVEAVVGCFFFKPLDQVLGVMPVLSRILLGPDRSLFGVYFELSGPWDDPAAGLIPTKTLALGPASFLFEGVPAFVKRGVEAIQSILPSLDGGAPAVASPADSADPQGDGS